MFGSERHPHCIPGVPEVPMSFAASLLNDLVEEEAQEKVLAMVRALDSVWKPQQCFPSLLALEMRQQVGGIAPEVQIT